MSWGQAWPVEDVYPPQVAQYKLVENRHMTHVVQRWDMNRTASIQNAFFNGCGYETW